MKTDLPKEQHWYKDRRLQVRLAAALAFIVGVGIYGVDWSGQTPKWREWATWTGFVEDTTIAERTEKGEKGNVLKIVDTKQPGKKLWDFMELLLVPFLLALLTYQLQRRETKRANDQADLEKEIAEANRREDALQAYLDRIANLLLDKELRLELLPNQKQTLISYHLNKKKQSNSSPNINFQEVVIDSDNHVRDVARIRTLTILRRLGGDKERQARVLDFLRDAELLEFLFERSILSGVNLEAAGLQGANLREAKLERADLKGADLRGAKLAEAVLWRANLEGANLEGTNLEGASFINATFGYPIIGCE